MNPTENTVSKKNKIWLVFGALLLTALVVISLLAIRNWGYETTDDAFIDGHVIPVNSRVSGQVLNVNVSDNQEVNKGDVLVELDPSDYRLKLEQSRADLEGARAEARKASADAERAKKLFEKEEVSRQVLDHALASADIARSREDLMENKKAQAELDLSYAKIAAPEAGKITRKSVETRSFVQIGQPLMAIVPKEVWVTANFKETQLARMKIGQEAAVSVDAYPGKIFHGHVESIQAGTGARFSLFPPENATGNFVKVVQRVPVKIIFDEPPEALASLSPGMSVFPKIKVR